MKIKIKIRLLVAALGGSVFSYSDACASTSEDSTSYSSSSSSSPTNTGSSFRNSHQKESRRKTFDSSTERSDRPPPVQQTRNRFVSNPNRMPLSGNRDSFVLVGYGQNPMEQRRETVDFPRMELTPPNFGHEQSRLVPMGSSPSAGRDSFIVVGQETLMDPDEHAPLPPRRIPSSTSYDSFMRLGQGSPRIRKNTMSGCLSQLDKISLMSVTQQEKGLARMIPIMIQKALTDALPQFVNLVIRGFRQVCEDGGINECSLNEFFELSLRDRDTFQYVTRDKRDPRRSVAIYSYAQAAVTGQNGIINRMKRNILDELFMVIQALIIENIPQEAIEQLTGYVDMRLDELTEALKHAMFEILRDIVFADGGTSCCGCCGKASKKDKQNLAMGITHMLGGVLGTFFGDGFERGADELAQGICGIIAAQSEE